MKSACAGSNPDGYTARQGFVLRTGQDAERLQSPRISVFFTAAKERDRLKRPANLLPRNSIGSGAFLFDAVPSDHTVAQ